MNVGFWHGPGWGGFGRHFARKHGRRLRRGILKFVVLKLLAEGERHGYDLMRVFQEKGWGAPRPGSMYPILGVLEEEGLVTSRVEGERRIYEITEKGRAFLQEHLSHLGDFFEPEEAESDDSSAKADLREAATRLMQAVSQVGTSSKPETVAAVRELLDRTRKEIYTLLAQE